MIAQEGLVNFAQILSAGLTLVALAFAWFTYASQYRSALKSKKQAKISLIGAIRADLENIKPWAGNPYPNGDYWNNPEFWNWRVPLAKLVFPFPHEAIQAAIRDGIDRGLSAELVSQLVELEQAIIVFEQGLDLITRVVYHDPVASAKLREKMLLQRNRPNDDPPILSEDEKLTITLLFERYYYLHVSCIGEKIEGRNLHSAYLRTQELLEDEEANIDSDKQWQTPRWHWTLNVLAAVFLAVGIGFPTYFILAPVLRW
jgi:hypothetical protein